MTDELTQEELRWLVDHKEEIIHQLNVENDDLHKQLLELQNDKAELIAQRDTWIGIADDLRSKLVNLNY